jgi:hypothetical protein
MYLETSPAIVVLCEKNWNFIFLLREKAPERVTLSTTMWITLAALLISEAGTYLLILSVTLYLICLLL